MSTTADVQTAAPAAPDGGRSIVSPLVDFLLLGGLSLILLPMALTMPVTAVPLVAFTALMLADVVNHPHFAASYQIFYRNYREKAFGTTLPPGLRNRYIFAGIAVPILLVAFFAVSFVVKSPMMLGLTANALMFLVGWHYNKQGYGMLMVDAAFKKRFFNDREKKILLANAYVCWFIFWLTANYYAYELNMFGIIYYALPVPVWLLYVVGAAAAVTSLMAASVFIRRMTPGAKPLPIIGVGIYILTIYYWSVVFFSPVALFFVPAFHSLQYLFIVWRFESNRARMEEREAPAKWPVARFAVVAIILGLAGFWWLPRLFDRVVSYDSAFGAEAFMFMFWIFINIHHYFMDNVMWRRENPDTARFLFGAKPKPAEPAPVAAE